MWLRGTDLEELQGRGRETVLLMLPFLAEHVALMHATFTRMTCLVPPKVAGRLAGASLELICIL